MTGSAALRKARQLGIVLELRGAALHYRALRSSIGQLRASLQLLKADIVAILKAPGTHEVCTFFCGDPKAHRYCRECGGTWADYVQHCTGGAYTEKVDSDEFAASEGPVALEDELSPGYTPVELNKRTVVGATNG
jgi:hypothetical protein